jgi:hypothetical protein
LVISPIDNEFIGHIPWDLETNLENPVYPSGEEAIIHSFDLEYPEEWSIISPRIEIVIPARASSLYSLFD